MKNRLNPTLFLTGILLVLSLTLAACGSPVTVGPTQTTQLTIPGSPTLNGAFNLSLQTHQATVTFGTTGNNLVEGNLLYNAPELKPAVQTGPDSASITEPAFEGALPGEGKTEWELNLNRTTPINLDFNAGNSSGAYDLGGLSLKALNYRQDGGESRLYFSQPNQLDLENLTVNAISAKLMVAGLGDARLRNATFTVKKGDLTLDFFKDNGKLIRPIEKVLVKGEESNLTIFTAPVPAEIILDGGQQDEITALNWTQSGRTYRNAAWALAGPDDLKLTLHIELEGGHLYLY